MRLIDADALKLDIACVYGSDFEGKIIDSMIDDMPTVDAVPVVRCKDCKNSDPWYADERRCFLWHEDGVAVLDDGFCNYAERKEE